MGRVDRGSSLGISEHESPPAIAVLPSPYGWEREANSRWDEETDRRESRKVYLDSARKRPFESEGMRCPMQAQASGSIQRFGWASRTVAAAASAAALRDVNVIWSCRICRVQLYMPPAGLAPLGFVHIESRRPHRRK